MIIEGLYGLSMHVMFGMVDFFVGERNLGNVLCGFDPYLGFVYG